MPLTTVPLLSEHKTLFVWNRLLETLFGGVRLFIGTPVPCYVYVIQLFVYQIPIVVGSAFTLLCELGVLSQPIAACACCGVVVLGVGLIQIVTWRMLAPSSSVVHAVVPASVSPPQIHEVNQMTFDSCFSWPTAANLFSSKKYPVNCVLHTVLCGLLTGYGVLYLLPSRLTQELYARLGVAYLVFILGWCTLCNALYSLAVQPPFEPATFQPLDRWEIRPLMRPFYVALCYAIDLYAWSSSTLLAVNGLFHIIFIFLPCLWFLNVLPPLDSLFLWLLEQIQIWIAGGSPTIGTTRLCLQLGLWLLSVIILLYMPLGAFLLLAAIFGYLFSLDLVSMFSDFTTRFKSVPPRSSDGHSATDSGPVVRTVWNCSDFLYFVIMLVAVTILSLSLQFALASQLTQSNRVILYCLGLAVFLLCLTSWLANSIQSVYLFGGLLRNPLYPPNTRHMTKFTSRLHRLNLIGKFRTVAVNVVAPLLLNAYIIVLLVAFSSDMSPCLNRVVCKLWYCITIIRAFRWSWQQSESALFETTVVHFLLDVIPLTSVTANKACVLLLVAFLWDRIANFARKLQTFCVLLLASVAQVKQRRPYSFYLFFLNLMCLPFTIGMMLFSAFISAPLLPLFTLPIFWFGFPRPIRFWPKQSGDNVRESSTSSDEIYYREVAPKLCTELGRLLSNGGLGAVRPGDHFLLRFQDRMLWLSVAEAGHGYVRVDAKGLELQQTSCHAVEASAVDAILELAFEVEADGGGERGGTRGYCCRPNRTLCHLYQPLNIAVVDTYVDTRNVLTGVIHSPETLQLITSSFPRCITWVLVRHFLIRRREVALRAAALLRSSIASKPTTKQFGVTTSKQPVSTTIEPRTTTGTTNARDNAIFASSNTTATMTRPATTVGTITTTNRSRPSTSDGFASLPKVTSPYDTSHAPASSGDLPTPWPDDPWLDDDDDLLDSKPGVVPRKSAVIQLHSLFGVTDCASSQEDRLSHNSHEHQVATPVLPGAVVTELPGNDLRRGQTRSGPPTVRGVTERIERATTDEAASVAGFPAEWLSGPLSDETISSVDSHFSSSWFALVGDRLSRQFEGGDDNELLKLSRKVNGNVVSEASDLYRQVVLTCHVIVNQIYAGGKRAVISPSLVYRIFNREMPWSPHSDWLLEIPDLYNLAIKAFRYACKLALDQTLLGEVESDAEFADYLQEYDESWLICPDNDPMWMEAIRTGTPNLFSLGYNPVLGTYTSHLLVRRPIPVYIGKLNREAVLAMWSTLSLELLYLTNDDDERYSIQAHSGLLRNLIVQSADPPLGYPIFMEQAILIKTRPSESFAADKNSDVELPHST